MRGKGGLKDFDVKEFWRRRGDFMGLSPKPLGVISDRRFSKGQKRKARKQRNNALRQNKNNHSPSSVTASMREDSSQYHGRTRVTSTGTNLHFGERRRAREWQQNNVGGGLPRMDLPIRGGRDAQRQGSMPGAGVSLVTPVQQYGDEYGGVKL